MARISLGLGPSLHQLRGGSLRFVRRLHSYYGLARLATPVQHRLRLFAFPMHSGITNPIFFLVYILYVYYIVAALEGDWGPGPTTVFILFAYVVAV